MTGERPTAPRAAATLEQAGRRSLAARIRELMPWIKEQFARGYTHEQVAASLRDEGLEVSVGTLRKNLYRRSRESRGATGPTHRTAPSGAVEQSPTSPPPKHDAGNVAASPPSPPPKAATEHLTLEEAMDPQKRAAFADQFFVREPLVIKPKRKSEN